MSNFIAFALVLLSHSAFADGVNGPQASYTLHCDFTSDLQTASISGTIGLYDWQTSVGAHIDQMILRSGSKAQILQDFYAFGVVSYDLPNETCTRKPCDWYRADAITPTGAAAREIFWQVQEDVTVPQSGTPAQDYPFPYTAYVMTPSGEKYTTICQRTAL